MELLYMTVAKVAAIISTGYTLFRFAYGLALIIILAYLMPNDDSSSIWSFCVRVLNCPSWSAFFSTDTSDTIRAQKPVNRLDAVSKMVVILVIVAGIITPLGLEPTVSQVPIDSVLHSLTDSQSLSLAITPRGQYVEERYCWSPSSLDPLVYQTACPGRRLTKVTDWYALQTDLSIPHNITTVFSSTSYAGPFDMQFRRFFMATNPINFTARHPYPEISIADSIILSNSLFAVSGLIIDTTESPGAGIANVQVPYLPNGGTWNQSMLWIEPETACLDLGFTVNFQMDNMVYVSNGFNEYITDQGGFSNFNFTEPTLGKDGQQVTVKERAAKLAYMLNTSMMDAYNITKNATYIGKSWPLAGGILLNHMQILPYRVDWIHNFMPFISTDNIDLGLSIDNACKGFDGQDEISINTTAVECFIFLGAPKRTDDGDSNLWDLNSTWKQSAFACASTVRAKMQTLTVSSNSNINETTTLSSLTLQRQDVNASVLWAVESGMAIDQMDPYWGPIADLYENSSSLNTLRSKVFYLPANRALFTGWDPIADASSLPAYALRVSKSWASRKFRTTVHDYTGSGNAAMLQLWRNLSASADTVSRITNLIWTDIMANNLYSNVSVQSTTVMKNVPTVGYNLLYAIPAFISLALWIVLMVITTAFFARDRTSLHTIRQALYQTSLGRMVTRITTTSTKYAENTRKLAVQEGSKRIGLKTISNNQSDLIQFDLVSEQSSLLQMLNNSENTIKRRKRVPPVSDSSDLYPLYHDSDKK